MLTATLSRVARGAVGRRGFSEAAKSTTMSFSFAVPHTALYFQAPVEHVILPGVNGEYGVSAGHVSLAEQLKPGVVKVVHKLGDAPVLFFVSGGFAFTDEEKTEVTTMEAVKVDDLEPSKVEAHYKQAVAEFAAATTEEDKAEAALAMETAKAMGLAVGLVL
ncbi:hypothetical protein M885DRAFT_513514 [Pelagophyceae sp. CCMP2097]|nr:hypothetical protein M885DRAFT_513514 [Pelagophyceae sp. CCMP2097]